MSENDDTIRRGAPTRRECVKYGGALVSGGVLAGCSGDGTDTTPTETATNSRAGTETSTPEDESYSVTMSPVGTVEFDSVPENAAVYDYQWADHLVALGQQDRIVSLGFPDNYYTGFYDELPGVSFATSDLTPMWSDGLDKELFYELDADVHHLDPYRWLSFDLGWSREDFDEVKENVGPFFANRWSLINTYPGEEPYEFYTLWELLDKFAQVYRVQSRSQALIRIRDEMVESIQSKLPPREERPRVAHVIYDDETFHPMRLNDPGFAQAHTRPLGAIDVFAESEEGYASEGVSYSMEGMLEFDPDVMVDKESWINPNEQTEAFLNLGGHPVGRELTAVQNDRLYAGGTIFQGPIFNLFQIELTAKQIYPDLFGEPPESNGSVSKDEQLFDRQPVADIINGEF